MNQTAPAEKTRPPLPEPEKFDSGDAGRPWPDAKDKLARPLASERCTSLEYKDPGHWICLETGTPYEEVFRPSFWANVIRERQMEVGQTIKVRNDEMTVFADGRAILKGTQDPAVARSLYARFIGA